MIDVYSSEFSDALKRAGDELGMPDYFQPCVRPLFTMPMQQWPMCCGGRCEPCAQQLVSVALRMFELLKLQESDLAPASV